jgi:hypothetical protein
MEQTPAFDFGLPRHANINQTEFRINSGRAPGCLPLGILPHLKRLNPGFVPNG